MQKIVVFAGRKQSGKSSACNFLHGHILRKNQEITFFDINEDGKLIVNAMYEDENGNQQEGQGVILIDRKDYEFAQYAEYHIWPYIKSYNFADKLKSAVTHIFGIDPNLVNGSNEDKNTLTNIKFSDMAIAYLPAEIEKMKKAKTYGDYMTIRDVLKVFGTKVCRRIQDSCWIDSCIRDIIAEQVPFVTIGDCRFPNEVKAMQEIGAKVIYLTRKIDDDTDPSESSLDGYEGFDHVIDNADMDIHQKNLAIFAYLKSIGYVEGEI